MPFIYAPLRPHHPNRLKARGNEPYLMRDSPKLLSRDAAITLADKWSNEMGGDDKFQKPK